MNPYYVMMLFGLALGIYAAILVIYDRKVRQPRMRELERLIAEDYEKALREDQGGVASPFWISLKSTISKLPAIVALPRFPPSTSGDSRRKRRNSRPDARKRPSGRLSPPDGGC
jgi:hypothetical protein